MFFLPLLPPSVLCTTAHHSPLTRPLNRDRHICTANERRRGAGFIFFREFCVLATGVSSLAYTPYPVDPRLIVSDAVAKRRREGRSNAPIDLSIDEIGGVRRNRGDEREKNCTSLLALLLSSKIFKVLENFCC